MDLDDSPRDFLVEPGTNPNPVRESGAPRSVWADPVDTLPNFEPRGIEDGPAARVATGAPAEGSSSAPEQQDAVRGLHTLLDPGDIVIEAIHDRPGVVPPGATRGAHQQTGSGSSGGAVFAGGGTSKRSGSAQERVVHRRNPQKFKQQGRFRIATVSEDLFDVSSEEEDRRDGEAPPVPAAHDIQWKMPGRVVDHGTTPLPQVIPPPGTGSVPQVIGAMTNSAPQGVTRERLRPLVGLDDDFDPYFWDPRPHGTGGTSVPTTTLGAPVPTMGSSLGMLSQVLSQSVPQVGNSVPMPQTSNFGLFNRPPNPAGPPAPAQQGYTTHQHVPPGYWHTSWEVPPPRSLTSSSGSLFGWSQGDWGSPQTKHKPNATMYESHDSMTCPLVRGV